MKALGSIFHAAVDIRNRLYDSGGLRVQHLQGPVVSIGNISVGGAGKTPFVILLGTSLKLRGINFNVLSRGYRRETKGAALVDPAGRPEQFGDEPLLIARKLGVPVVVGEDRYEAGRLAEDNFGPQLHLLDDGFQHRRLARDFDIVMVSAADLRDRLIPAGRLREPPSSLARADAVVIDAATEHQGLALEKGKLWRIRRGIVAPTTRAPCLAFCGIAHPENFFAQLRSAGLNLVETRCFRDHYRYSPIDVEQLLELRKSSGAAAFLTTEKDAVNLGDALGKLQPIHTVPVQIELLDADYALDAMLARVGDKKRPARETI